MAAAPLFADGEQARLSGNPDPAISNKPLEITISTSDFGSEVYCYTWCESVNGHSKTPTWGWNDVHNPKFRMTGSGGTYKLTITDIKNFYSLTDSELEGLTKLGFIAKTTSGRQTADCFIEVVQGRRDAYSGGEGTQDSPFILTTSADFAALASTPGDWGVETWFRMEEDIDISSLDTPLGNTSTPFRANFDGAGHIVSGLFLEDYTIGRACGLFGVIDGGTVRNLGITDSETAGATYVGLLAGELSSGTIENCYSSGKVTSTSICAGGLVGENVAGVIRNCYSSARVMNLDDYATGGLVGKNSGVIRNTYASGAVGGYDYVGGVAGANYGTLSGSVALNPSVICANDFRGRLGGNNNSENGGEANHSWESIVASAGHWESFGHHASTHAVADLSTADKFRALMDWDFDNVWEWRREGDKEYPALKGLAGQICPLPESFFQVETAVTVIGSEGGVAVGPNPVVDRLTITSGIPLEGYLLFSLSGHCTGSGHLEGNQATIDMSGMAPGLHVLRVLTADGSTTTHKIIKK